MDTDSGSSGKQSTPQAADYGVLPEVEAYAFLLVIIAQIDRRHFTEVRAIPLVNQSPAGHFCKMMMYESRGLLLSRPFNLHLQAKETSTAAIQRLGAFNRRTLDGMTSRIYFYHSWAHECTGSLPDIRGCNIASPARSHRCHPARPHSAAQCQSRLTNYPMLCLAGNSWRCTAHRF